MAASVHVLSFFLFQTGPVTLPTSSLFCTLVGLEWIPPSLFILLEWNCASAWVTTWAFGKKIIFDFCHLLHCIIVSSICTSLMPSVMEKEKFYAFTSQTPWFLFLKEGHNIKIIHIHYFPNPRQSEVPYIIRFNSLAPQASDYKAKVQWKNLSTFRYDVSAQSVSVWVDHNKITKACSYSHDSMIRLCAISQFFSLTYDHSEA